MKLTITEQILLLTLWRLEDEAYGVNIRKRFCHYTGKEVAFGTLYNNLDQLIKKGYAVSFKGEPTAVRGGKRKVYYKMTSKGMDALQASRDLQAKLWEDIPEMAFIRNNQK